MILQEKIDQLHVAARKTGMSRMGGYLPHSPRRLTDSEVHFGLQRFCGWKVPVATIAALRED